MAGAVIAWIFVFCNPIQSTDHLFLTSLFLGLGGLAAATANYTMMRCYAIGHRGISAACGMSSIIISFLFGIIVMGERPSTQSLIGLFILVSGLLSCILQKLRKDHSSSQGTYKDFRKWLLFMGMTILLNGISAIMMGMPSWLGYHNCPFLLRSAIILLLSSFANMLLCIATQKPITAYIKQYLPSAMVWGVIAVATNFMFFVSMDALTKINLGSFKAPLTGTVTLVSFSCYSAIRCKEKYQFATVLGIVLCLLGIIVISLK
jgi:uncharacterized membrane protein